MPTCERLIVFGGRLVAPWLVVLGGGGGGRGSPQPSAAPHPSPSMGASSPSSIGGNEGGGASEPTVEGGERAESGEYSGSGGSGSVRPGECGFRAPRAGGDGDDDGAGAAAPIAARAAAAMAASVLPARPTITPPPPGGGERREPGGVPAALAGCDWCGCGDAAGGVWRRVECWCSGRRVDLKTRRAAANRFTNNQCI